MIKAETVMDTSEPRPAFLVIMYSSSQDAWHIDHIEDLITRNLNAFLQGKRSNDYMLLGIGRTYEEIADLQGDIINTREKVLQKREKIKQQFMAILRERLQEIRKDKGLSQSDLAARIGTSQTTISRWETGKKKIDSHDLQLFCQALEYEYKELVKGTPFDNHSDW